MIARASLAALLCTSAAAAAIAQQAPPPLPSPPIVNASPEQKLIIDKTPDGGLPPAVGVQNIQIFRATRVPEFWKDDHGWTYNHHMDMAIWKGHYLVAFTNGEKDEDVWPSHELYTYSTDGLHWSWPEQLFPQGMSTSLRTYFYYASNDRLIAVAGLRTGTEKLDEATKGGLIGHEIFADMKPGDPFTLIPPPTGTAMMPVPMYDQSRDQPLVEAFKQVLANHTFLEQQDNGVLLGKNRMDAYNDAPRGFGKALCFFRRKDGALVGIAKNGFVTVSTDDGKTWSKPAIPPGLLTNNAKVWVQQTSDGRYAMVYNPVGRDRFPLVVTTSDDGITFDHMRVIHGEVPQQRYPGLNKNVGAQYIRGVSIFANDGSMKSTGGDKDMLIVYSSNKEDIWVSRIPVPIKADETEPVSDHFDGPPREGFLVPNWNVYAPRWAPVSIVDVPAQSGQPAGKAMQLQDTDPYDYARASRVFKQAAKVTIQFKLLLMELPAGLAENPFEIDVDPALGTARPIRLAITPDGTLRACNGPAMQTVAHITPGQPLTLQLAIDCAAQGGDKPQAGAYTLTVNGQSSAPHHFAEPAASVARLTLRTGPHRVLGTPVTDGHPTYPTPVDPATDKPTPPTTFQIRDVDIR